MKRGYARAIFLTPEQIEQMAAVGCTNDDIATIAGCSESHIKKHYAAELARGRAGLRNKLRRRQVERANEGSDAMLIWLGKQYLAQRDKAEQHLSVETWDVVIGGDQSNNTAS